MSTLLICVVVLLALSPLGSMFRPNGEAPDGLVELAQDAVEDSTHALKAAASWRLIEIVLAAGVPLALGYLVLRECSRHEPTGEDVVHEYVALSQDEELKLDGRCRDLIVELPKPEQVKRIR